MIGKKITLALLDDEVHIIRLLEALIPWNELNLEYVGNAQNGIDGRALILQKKPDIVISDIKMPGLDGLSLIAEIHESLPNTEFIILSGFSQFEYAKKAITYDVKNYLLKPINKGELCTALEKLITNKKNRQQEIQILQESDEQKKNKIFENMLTCNYPVPECLFPDGSRYFLCLIKIDSTDNSISNELYQLVHEKMIQIIKKHGFNAGFYINKDCITFLSLSDDFQNDVFLSKLQQIYFDFKQISTLFPQLIFTLFESGLTEQPIKNVYKNLLDLLPLRRKSDTSHIIILKDIPAVPFPSQSLDLWDKACEKMVSSADITIVSELIESFLKDFSEEIWTIREQIYLSAARHLAVLIEGQHQKGLEWYSLNFVPALHLAFSDEDLTVRFKSLIYDFLKDFFANQQKDSIRPIRLADAYMQEHFSDYDISLEKVSDIVGLTPAYFSALYKKEKGMGFLESLTAVRIKNARNLLQNGNETVAKIASSVGYSDIKYFGKIFKKITGITPNEFRQFYS